MPFATFKRVHSVSSEDAIHCASNLLKSETTKKWKTFSNGEKSANVVLELEESEIVTGVDIGNEHSAFIEVLVGKNGWSSESFKELILTSSFMTPLESKNSTNINRIRCFNQSHDSWVKTDTNEKWDLIKFICTQPFNKHTQYGLSLVKVHIVGRESKELVPKQFIQQQHKIIEESKKSDAVANSNKFVGNFRLRDDSDEDDASTSLFSRWKKHSTTPDSENKKNAAASIRDASRLCHETTTKKLVFEKHSDSTKKYIKETVTVLDRNRNDLLYNKDDEISNEKFEKKIAIDKDQLEKDKIKTQKKKKEEIKPINLQKNDSTMKTASQSHHDSSFSSKMKNLFDDDSSDIEVSSTVKPPKQIWSFNTDNSNKRPSSETLNSVNPKRNKRCDIYKPFNKLLEGVVLVISGIQNPNRANLRSKALELGAKYKSDWDSTCTHLICAFKNTPKYNQVKEMKGKIIKKSWIEKCYNLKKRLPWRRYALDSDEESKTESEDEILDIVSQPSTSDFVPDIKSSPEPSTSRSPKNCTNNRSPVTTHHNTEHDCEDLIKNVQKMNEKYDKILNQCSDEKDNISITIAKDIYDATTDEDDYTKEKNKHHSKNEKLFFGNRKFFLESKLSTVDRKKLIHMIEEFGGTECQLANQAHYVITNNRSNYNNLNNFKGEIVKPLWIYECNDMECFIPTKRYLL